MDNGCIRPNCLLGAYHINFSELNSTSYGFIFQTWGEKGFLLTLGSLDFAGGTPVHIASGFAGLAMTMVLGKRVGFEDDVKEWKAHNISNVFLGTALLWFGWIGFNGGSALAGTPRAAMAAMGEI